MKRDFLVGFCLIVAVHLFLGAGLIVLARHPAVVHQLMRSVPK